MSVSTRCHGSPVRDVLRRVDVRVVAVPAGHAPEHRLAVTVGRCDVLAGMAGLRRVRSLDLLHPPGGLLLQPGHQQAPYRFQDAPVQPSLRPNVAARLVLGAARGTGHSLHGQTFDPDHIEPAVSRPSRVRSDIRACANSAIEPRERSGAQMSGSLVTTNRSPDRFTDISALSSSGRLARVPEALSMNTRSQPAAVSASCCAAGF